MRLGRLDPIGVLVSHKVVRNGGIWGKFAWDFRPAMNCRHTLPVTSGGNHGEQLVSNSIDVGQREQHLPLMGVLRQPTISGFPVAKEVLDGAEWVFDLRPDTGFKPLDVAGQASHFIVWELPDLAAHERDMPIDCALCVFLTLADPGVAGIGIHPALLVMQQFAGHDHIADIGRRADCRVDQPGVGIDADVHLHPDCQLLPFLVGCMSGSRC